MVDVVEIVELQAEEYWQEVFCGRGNFLQIEIVQL